MLIAHVITRLLRAGSEENTLSTCEAQLRSGHEVILIYGRDYDESIIRQWAHRIQLIRVNSLVRELSPIHDLLAVRELLWIFRRIQPDLVHTHQSKAGILGRLAAHVEGVPNIVHGVHILPFLGVGLARRAIYVAAERAIASFTDAFIDVSGGMLGACVANRVGFQRQHHVVHSGFDLAKFRTAQKPRNWRTLLDLRPGEPVPPVIVMLAALEPRKRHLELISLFRQLVDQFPNVRLLLAGEGTLRGEVERAIAHHNLSANIKLIGFATNPEQLIALADVCLLTSIREGLPRSVVQYLAGGRPAIVTYVPGIEEVVTHGVNGLITPSEDLSATVAALSELLGNKHSLSKLRAGARQSDLSSWDVENMCRQIEDIYRNIDRTPDKISWPAGTVIAA